VYEINEIKVYDFLAGKYVGNLLIPSTEKCSHLQYEDLKFEDHIRIVTYEMMTNTAIFTCQINQPSVYMSLTVYNVLPDNGADETIGSLVRNSTMVLPIQDSGNFTVFWMAHSCYIIMLRNVLKLIFISYIHQSLTVTQRYTIPIQDHVQQLIALNEKSRIFLLGNLHWTNSFEIIKIKKCILRKPLIPNKVNVTQYFVRKFRIYIRGRNELGHDDITIHQQGDTLRNIPPYNDHQGIKTYSVVDVYRNEESTLHPFLKHHATQPPSDNSWRK
jgi:hypothetical protein